eukprot:3476772-Pyramimonas_sp.AAC.1
MKGDCDDSTKCGVHQHRCADRRRSDARPGRAPDALIPMRLPWCPPPRSSRLRAARASPRCRLHRRAATGQEQAAYQTRGAPQLF